MAGQARTATTGSTTTWAGIVASSLLIVFNRVGLPYDGLHDNVLIVVGFAISGLIIWYSWNWIT